MRKYKFKAKIEAGDGGGARVLFPYDTEKEFATKGKVPVRATVNGLFLCDLIGTLVLGELFAEALLCF
jgi:hypothetical protein